MKDYIAVIPVHNGEETIIEAIQSVIAQSVTPQKIVVFDNASTDGTSETVREYAKFCTIKLELIQSDKLLPPNKSFEKSIATITGRFLWLAADDILFPWAAEKLIESACGATCFHTVAGASIFMKNNGILQPGRQFPVDLSGIDFLNNPSDASLIYGMHTAEEFKELFPDEYFPAWDWSLLYRCVVKGAHIYGPLPISLRETTEIDVHRRKIEVEESGISRVFPYFQLTIDILRRQNIFKNFLLIPVLIRLNLKGYLNFGIHNRIYQNIRKSQRLRRNKNMLKRQISKFRRNQILKWLYSLLPLSIRFRIQRLLGFSFSNFDTPFHNLSATLNESDIQERDSYISLNQKISNFEFSPDSTFNAAQVVELIRYFLINSEPQAELTLNLSQVTINEEYLQTIVKGFERLFAPRKIKFSTDHVTQFHGIIQYYSLLWEREFLEDLTGSIKELSTVNNKSNKIVNLFLPQVPQPNRDAGSVDVLYLLAILKILRVKVNIYLEHLVTPNPVALDLLRRFGEVQVLSELQNSNGLNLVYGPYSYALYERYNLRGKFIYIMVDAVFRRFEQSPRNTSNSDRNILRYEQNALNNCEEAFCISSADQIAVADKFPSTPTKIYPIIRYPKRNYSENQFPRKWVTFIGSQGHAPNRLAVDWIIKNFAPLLHSANPDIKIAIAGIGTDPYDGLAPNVLGLGAVSHLSELYNKSFAAIAPMEIAAGINGKVVESLCFGVTPLISRPVARNLPSELLAQCEVAESLDEYIQKTIFLSKAKVSSRPENFRLDSVNGRENFAVLKSVLDL